MQNFEIGQDGDNILIMVDEGDNLIRLNEIETLSLIMGLAQELRELHRIKRAKS